MISLCRTQERRHRRTRKHDAWTTFTFGRLSALMEDRLPPGAGVHRWSSDASEVVTYVREGAVVYDDAIGGCGVIGAGEFQCRTEGLRARVTQTNASRTDWAHVFQLGFGPSRGRQSSFYEQKRFGAGDRRDGLCIVASPDGRRGSVHLQEDVLVYSALLEPGQHRVHELLSERGAWLHVVQGEVRVADIILSSGDGAGITEERAVSLTSRGVAEILLLDVSVH